MRAFGWFLIIGLGVTALWQGVTQVNLERENRRALAYASQEVAYRLGQIGASTELGDWTDPSWKLRFYESTHGVVQFGFMAERIPVRGRAREVAWQLGQIARDMHRYEKTAALALLEDEVSEEKRLALEELAQTLKAAGWSPTAPDEERAPVAWSEPQGWGLLSDHLDRLLPLLRP